MFNFAEISFVKKKVAIAFGVLGMLAMISALFLMYKNELFPAYAFCTIAVFSTYIFLIYTQSKIAVISAFICHGIAIIAMYLSGSIIVLSVSYILLPFFALMIRNIGMEKLAHTLKLWIEPLILIIAIALYVVEIKVNKNLTSSDAKIFPIAYFLANGFMILDVLYDGIKIRKRVKKGNGLAAGEVAPLFCLQNENNEQVCLSDFKGKHNVLLIFVRGEWCPMCHIMLRTYTKESAQFREKNVFLLVVGPDPTGVNRKMAEELKLDFHILSDTGLNVTHLYRLKIKAEHLLHANNYNLDNEVPLPASFLIDKEGMIRYCSNPDKIGEVVKLADIFPILQSIEGNKA
jgi:peroxiredoxin